LDCYCNGFFRVIEGSGVPWVNEEGVSGLNVAVGDSRELAKACNRILSSDRFRGELSVGARNRFISNFQEDLSVNRMMDIYQRLVL